MRAVHPVRLWLAFLSCTAILVGPMWAQARQLSSESGTQVATALVGKNAVLIVDSKIESDHPDGAPTRRDASRKLVFIGALSACGLDGNLGVDSEGRDMADGLRAWSKEHPQIEAAEAMPALLTRLSEIYDANVLAGIFSPYPRKVNERITGLDCIGYSNGAAALYEGQTVLAFGGSARVDNGPSKPNRNFFIDNGLVRLSGIFAVEDLFFFVNSREAITSFSMSRDLRKLLLELQTFASIPEHRKIFSAMDLANESKCTKCWTLDDAKLIFSEVFSLAEQRPDVAPPNQLTILTECGLLRGKLEDPWPSCSPKTRSLTKVPHTLKH